MTFTALLFHNPQFRRLWIAQVVSQLGDWFNAVAVYALLLDLTGSATLVAAMMVVQLLPLALVGPLAGVVVDRMSRRTLMIGADLARAVLFAGLVFVRSADQIWLAFLLVTLGVIATAFFEPARTAMLPDVVPRESLITANALSAATWAVMLAVGASVGGAMTVLVGRDAAFICNGLSFLASAAGAAGPARRRNAPVTSRRGHQATSARRVRPSARNTRRRWHCSASRASGRSPAG